MSWTGSETQRREQGSCRPPEHAPNREPKFFIAAGTTAFIKRVEQITFGPYVTKLDRGFERYESYDRENRRYVFRDRGFQLAVSTAKVRHRSEQSGPEPYVTGGPCTECGSYDTRQYVVEVDKVPTSIRLECCGCGRHLRYLDPETVERVE